MAFPNRRYLTCILALFTTSAIWSAGQTKAAPSAGSPAFGGNDQFRAGGLSFNFPSPANNLVETGPDYRVILEPLAPDANRLVAAFVEPQALDALHTGTQPPLQEYALVEIPRRAEFVNVDENSFKQAADSIGQKLSGDVSGTMKDSQEELDQRLKELGRTQSVTLDKPLPLGQLFSKPDASAYGMVMPVTTKDGTIQVAMAVSIMRVHNRVLFAYFFMRFKDQSTIARLRTTDEQWTDAILSANR
jgi:hypothetical protein